MSSRERIETLQKLLEMDPADAFTRYALGLEFLEDDPARARSLFGEVLERDSDYVAAWFQLGKVNLAMGRTEAAREAWERGLTVAERQQDWHTHAELEEALAELD